MSNDDPRKAIVSVWHGEANRGTLLGSGAFITPRLVLTAKHVVRKRNAARVHLGFVEGQRTVPVQKIHRHKKFDIALLELTRDFPQDLVRLDYHRSALEKTSVDLYGINPDTESRDECHRYTLGTWNAQTSDFLFDHAQRKGYSGGVAVSQGDAIGVITRRHTSEQQGAITPLYVVKEWLEPFLASSWRRDPPLPVTPVAAELPQTPFTSEVRQQIGAILKRQKLLPLSKALVATAPHSKPENVLIPQGQRFSIDTALATLHKTTATCLQHEVDHDSSAVEEIATGATQVLGWLVLLAVRDHWAKDRARSQTAERPFQPLEAEYIALPVETEIGVEVVVSRLYEHAATFEMDPDSGSLFSTKRVKLGDLETGFDPRDSLADITRLIWRTVLPEPIPDPLSPGDLEFLKETLNIRLDLGQSYYLLIPASPHTSVIQSMRFLNALHEILPDLGTFMLGFGTGEQVFVIRERRLMARISEFLRMLRGYL